MEIRQMEYFIYVSEEKSFIKAAKRAYVSQQALSKAIQNLEKELDVPLFVRTNAGVQLTDYGEAFLKCAEQVLESVNNIVQELRQRRERNHEVITVGMTEGLSKLILDDLWAYQGSNADIQIRLIEAADRTVEKWVIENKVDIGFIGAMGDKKDSERFNYYSLLKSKTYLAVSTANPLAKNEKIKLIDLADEKFALGTEENNVHNLFLKVCHERRFTPHIAHQSADISFLKQIVRSNKGIFLFPEHAKDYLNEPDIRILEFEEEVDIHYSYLITKKNRKVSKQLNMLLDFLITQVGAIRYN
ncbi:LysR family transcriptional regulator [Dehalobacter sp. DCM]|uniref:LysR family transcriptional regulator n=1 Tax=Dehalobacter sp. DCM TaxID=2907827 RepID=UPI0030815CE2|nr:LysR family transcriptional regulator [Dehalobacter sp. DCM]